MVIRSFVFGVVFSIVLFACAGAGYRYYGLDGVSYEQGRLLGPKEADDLPFSNCQPNQTTKHPCVVMFANEFFELKQDYEDTKQKLSDCQSK